MSTETEKDHENQNSTKKPEKRSFWEKVEDWWEAAKDGYVESNDPKFNGGGYGGA